MAALNFQRILGAQDTDDFFTSGQALSYLGNGILEQGRHPGHAGRPHHFALGRFGVDHAPDFTVGLEDLIDAHAAAIAGLAAF